VSREEAVEAYTAGRISRRTFVRHLVAAGVSVAAALTYAEVLAPGRSSGAAPRGVDVYPEYPEPPEPPEPPAPPGPQPPPPPPPPVDAGAGGTARPPEAVRVQPRLTN
jgi:hypothetical protein